MTRVKLCSVNECEKRAGTYADGTCPMHRRRWEKYGDFTTVGRAYMNGPRIKSDVIERFWSHVDKTDTCWLWTAARLSSGGYGAFRIEGRTARAHRFAYELIVGPIPKGLVLDHLCRVTNCVRPDHLEPVTDAENLRRSPFYNGHKTHCKYGHEFTEANTYVTARGGRHCRICDKRRAKEQWLRHQAKNNLRFAAK